MDFLEFGGNCNCLQSEFQNRNMLFRPLARHADPTYFPVLSVGIQSKMQVGSLRLGDDQIILVAQGGAKTSIRELANGLGDSISFILGEREARKIVVTDSVHF